MVDRATTNAIQDGITIDPATPDEALNADLKAGFAEWAADPDRCDLAQEQSFADMQWQALRANLVDGDIIPLMNRSGAVELVEAHRCRTPTNTVKNVVHGVKLERKTRRRIEYWLTKQDIDPYRTVSRVADMNQYPVRDGDGQRQVCHVYHPKRVSQTRGVTAFAPVFDPAGMIEDIMFAKLIQQQMVACFAVIEERPQGFKLPSPTNEPAVGPQTTETDADGVPRTLEGMGPGMRIKGAPGAKLHLDSANVPNPEFFEHMRLTIQLISLNFGLPLILAMLDASETNFSGWRGAMEQAKLGFQSNQRMIYQRLVKPIYQWHVRRRIGADPAVRRRHEQLGQTLFAHTPGYPTWPYVEPLKDASADLLQTRNALISQRRRCARRGLDWDDLSTEIVDDNAMLIEKAQQKADALNEKYPKLGVTWRELACLPTPDGMTVSGAVAMEESDSQPGGRQRQEDSGRAA
jgi:capsid protein